MKTHGVSFDVTYEVYLKLFDLADRLGYESIGDMLEAKIDHILASNIICIR